MNTVIKNTLILTIIMVISGAFLGLANQLTIGRINEQKTMAYKESLADIFPQIDNVKEKDGYSEIYKDNQLIGYVSEGQAGGYSSQIHVLVGVDKSKKIVGVKILDMQETPGIGMKVGEKPFLDRFKGQTDPSDVDAITGATISSEGAKLAVKNALEAIP